MTKVASYGRGGKTYWYLRGGIGAKRRLVEICSPFVHPSMAYKFGLSDNWSDCEFCGQRFWFYESGTIAKTCSSAICKRLAKGTLRTSTVKEVVKLGERWVYDFTVQGNNNFWSGGFLSKNCVDEVDLIQFPKAYREALFIPTTIKDADGKDQPPITILTSSRKSSGGLVQEEIDNAEERGTAVRHHNILDVTARCPDERHRPDKTKMSVYYSTETLKTILPDEFLTLQAADPKKAETYVAAEVDWGCYHSCKIYAGCRGRLALQTSTAKALKPTYDTIRKFKEVGDIEMVKAQLFCWKPGNVGAVYANFSRSANMLTLDRMWEEITGEAPAAHITKGQLIELCMQRGFPVSGGMDFGFTHCFAVVVGFVVGRRLYIFDAFEVPELEPHQCVEVCDRRIKYLSPLLWPDTAYPAYIKMFRSAGYRCREHNKDVVGGIEAVRKKIAPAGMEPELYLIKGDDGCELLAKRLEGYRWKEDSVGRPTDVPIDIDDDLCFTEETEVLTSGGWMSLRDVTEEHEVLAISEDGLGSFERPLKVVKKSYAGEMFGVTHSHLEWQATADHAHAVMSQMDWKVRHRYRLQKRKVEDMASEMYWAQGPAQWPEGGGLFPGGADEAWVAGFWLAEGCFDVSRPTYLIVDQKKEPQKVQLRETLSRLGWHWIEYTASSGCTRFVMSGQGPRAAEWRERFGALSHGKKLMVKDVLAMTPAERAQFWDGYMAGDGSRTTSNWHFDSVSVELVDGAQVLSMMLGYGCRVVSYDCMRNGRTMVGLDGRREYAARQLYRGQVLRKKPVVHLSKSRIRNLGIRSTPVYCVRTSTGYFQARTNGKPFVAGNCDATRYLVQNTFGRSSGIVIAKGLASNIPDDVRNEKPLFPTASQQMSAKLHELTGGEAGSTIGMPAMVVLKPGETYGVDKKRLRKGGFFADFG
jgi:hypothetical protein